ncbi:MAG TPA: response regulator [Polyangiaceae bacterium]|jgi:CheY-like chemotaxis protein
MTRILIVEDDENLRAGLGDVLRAEGHVVLEARDGLDAWQQLHEDRELPDVILLDLMMPRMNGKTFRAQQLGEPRLASISTIVMTAQDLEPELRAELGALPICPKPLSLASLLAIVDEVTQPATPLKRCACGRTYDASSWSALAWVGEIDNGREVSERLELRDCACGSTLARELGRHAVSWRPPPPNSMTPARE